MADMKKRVGTAEIAELLGYSRTYVTDTITKRPDFPKPVQRLSQKNVFWNEVDVIRWRDTITQAA